jgi:hypothetical protein
LELPDELKAAIITQALTDPDNATCTEESYMKLLNALLILNNYKYEGHALAQIRRYSSKCVTAFRETLRQQVPASYDPFLENEYMYHGLWFLRDRLAYHWPYDDDIKAILWVRIEPWGGVSLLNVTWLPDHYKGARPYDAVFVSYAIKDGKFYTSQFTHNEERIRTPLRYKLNPSITLQDARRRIFTKHISVRTLPDKLWAQVPNPKQIATLVRVVESSTFPLSAVEVSRISDTEVALGYRG